MAETRIPLSEMDITFSTWYTEGVGSIKRNNDDVGMVNLIEWMESGPME